MSRCFPFPPPGYERKARPDDENLLEKGFSGMSIVYAKVQTRTRSFEEKRKEKKYKKEKKDRNKKGKKEDRDGKHNKERSEDKRRGKKDRKEKKKHKEDKNKEKQQEIKSQSEDKNTAGPLECSTVDNPGSSCTQSDETSDFKVWVDLGKRTRDDDKAKENLVVKKINLTGKNYSESPGKVGVFNSGNCKANAMLNEKRTNDRKFFVESNNGDSRGTRNSTVQNFVVGQQRRVEAVAGLVVGNVEKKTAHNKIDEHINSESRGDGNNDRDREGKSISSRDRKHGKEPNKEQQLKAREKSLSAVLCDSTNGSLPPFNESTKNSNLGKRKEPRINGFLHDDEIQRFKSQRPLPSCQEVVQNEKNLKPSKPLTKSVPELVEINNHKLNTKLSPSHRTAEDGSKFNATQSIIRFASARKSTDDNSEVKNNYPFSLLTLEDGMTLGTSKVGIINNEVDDKVGLAHPVLENGQVELRKAAALTEAGRHGATGNIKVDNKENKINGFIKDTRSDVCPTRPSSSTVKQIVGGSPKPPHPDSKYLSKIVAVPSIERLDSDKQEWLLGSNSLRDHEANSSSSKSEETEQVWAKALQIKSADVTALPYVIPY